jgi:hypothetical protein
LVTKSRQEQAVRQSPGPGFEGSAQGQLLELYLCPGGLGQKQVAGVQIHYSPEGMLWTLVSQIQLHNPIGVAIHRHAEACPNPADIGPIGTASEEPGHPCPGFELAHLGTKLGEG